MTDNSPEMGEPKNSLLSRVRARRADLDAGVTTDIPVPRWDDPPITVRYRVLDHPTIRRKYARIPKAPKGKRAEVEVEANADILIEACVGVFVVEEGKIKSLHPDGEDMEWTRFDPDLGRTFGLDDMATARDVLRKVYPFDGDILSTANEIVRFSGYRNEENNEAFLGE